MKDVRELVTLYSYVGTHNSYWCSSEDCNILHLSIDETAETEQAIELSPGQIDHIREIAVTTSSLLMTLPTEDDDIPVYLVGRKINKREWTGSASTWGDAPSIAHDLAQGLSLAEQVASEADSVIIILDRMGNIQHFNRLCEEYTGSREHEVVGQGVFTLFMSRYEVVAPRRNIGVFFREGNSYKIERRVKTCKGQRLFLFHSRFVHNGSGKDEIFLIYSGADIAEKHCTQERLRMLTNTNSITGLPNRGAVHELIGDTIENTGDARVGIVYLNLDNFKKVNDAYRRMFGDQLLQSMLLAILSYLGDNQLLARFSGDELIVLTTEISQSTLEATASRILTRLRQLFRVGSIEVYTGCSIDISLTP